MAKHTTTSDTIWFPAQRAWRTALAVGVPALLGLVVILPEVITAVLEGYGDQVPEGLRLWLLGAAAFITTTASVVSRVMAIPGVDAWLRRWTPFGSAPRGE
ncbi:hypothetical protein D9V30_08390 [Mycetocola reblochoni]|uniref:Uncharacterized protein n=2 Tax=Mycetocola reblochoni TaxID=331618 RepID=A0A1R4JQF8_9MICO|nr:hypothetical protein [Mycetocola reblochoni]RLP69315.1 hypothetical protein D9V30_08390 [Mycetocola reblochoni]SJN34239.1 hypothetical protein FM119_08860 [Mycetocola reblochoni REB411]